MDFDKKLQELQQKEAEIEAQRNSIKQDALTRVRDLVKVFKFTEDEVFGVEKPAKKAKVTSDGVDFIGFEAGKTYTDGKEFYTFGAKGKRPNWLKELVKSGKTAQDLLKK